MTIANHQSFMLGTSGGNTVVYIGSKIFPVADEAAKIKFCNQKIDELSARLGRPVQVQEIQQGYANIEDTRTATRKNYDSAWAPVLSKQSSNIERLRDETEARIESVKYGTNRDENLLQDMEAIIDRDAEEKVDAAERAKFLEKNAARINKIDNLIEQEAWNPDGTWELRTLLDRCKKQVVTEGGCPVEREKLTRSVEHVLSERAVAEEMYLTQQRTLIDQRLASLEQVSLSEPAEPEPEPAKPSGTPASLYPTDPVAVKIAAAEDQAS